MAISRTEMTQQQRIRELEEENAALRGDLEIVKALAAELADNIDAINRVDGLYRSYDDKDTEDCARALEPLVSVVMDLGLFENPRLTINMFRAYAKARRDAQK